MYTKSGYDTNGNYIAPTFKANKNIYSKISKNIKKINNQQINKNTNNYNPTNAIPAFNIDNIQNVIGNYKRQNNYTNNYNPTNAIPAFNMDMFQNRMNKSTCSNCNK